VILKKTTTGSVFKSSLMCLKEKTNLHIERKQFQIINETTLFDIIFYI
jgi:hypothetical protein